MAKLSRNQRKALAALLSTSTIREAAGKCDLAVRTLHGYLADPTFKAELRSRQDETVHAAVAALAGLAGEAIQALRGVLKDKEASAATKQRAAECILDQFQQLTTFAQFEARISDLEQQVAHPKEADSENA